MKKIKVCIAVSLDGFIAPPDGGLDGLPELSGISLSRDEYREFYDSTDTILMGNNIFQEFRNTDVEWPYRDKSTYVLSSHKNNLPPKEKENVVFITENVPGTVRRLKEQAGKDIWLLGGGQTIAFLLNCDLIDELQLCYFPVMLGKGIPLFPDKHKASQWELKGHTAYSSGILKVDYQRKS
jgi:dihydrofolate reductase